MQQRSTIRLVALFEVLKCVVVLGAATGLFALMHQNLHDLATKLVAHAHLNPASRYPTIFIDAATHLQDTRLLVLATGAAAYTTLRFVEGYGLYRERAWAELLAAAGGAIYVPFELLELVRRPTWYGAVLLGLNLLVVAVMLRALVQRRHIRGAS